MILSDLRDYLKTRKRAPLTDMVVRFDTDPDALRGMLGKWIAKGRVVKISDAEGCKGGCTGCAPRGIEVYEWRD